MVSRLCLVAIVLIAGTALCSCDERKARLKSGGTRMKKIPIERPWPVYDVAFSPDGRLLAAGRGYHDYDGGNGEVVVWETKEWERHSGFSASFTNQAQTIAFAEDGKSLLTATDKYTEGMGGSPWLGNSIFEWTVDDGTLKYTIDIDSHSEPSVGFVQSMAVSPNGQLIALHYRGSRPAILRRKPGERAYERTVGDGFILSPNGKSLAAIWSVPPSVHLYDAANGKKLANLDLKVENPFHRQWGEDGYEGVGDRLTCIRYSGDGKQIAVGLSEGSVRLLAGDLSKEIRSLEVSPAGEWVWAISFAAKADRLAAATRKGIRLFDTQTGKQLREWGKEEMLVMSVALSPDGKLLAVGYGGNHDAGNWPRSGCVKVWDTATGRLVKKLD